MKSARLDWKPIAAWSGVGALGGVLLWLLNRKPGTGTAAGVVPKTAPPPSTGKATQLSPACESPAAASASMLSSAPSAGGSCSTGFPDDLSARAQYILDRVGVGDFYVNWLPITSTYGGHTATFWVMADALKIDGVRVTVDATTEQKIADMVGAMLLTPKLADLIFMQADVRLPYFAHPDWVNAGTMTTTAHMIDQSRLIDEAIVKQTGSLDAAKDKIVSTVGKHWVVTNELGRAKPGSAQNYGWHLVGSGGESAVTNATDPKTGKPLRVIQGPWLRHDRFHTDYSQNCVLVAKKCMVDGRETTVEAVLTDPSLAPLASHQGVVRTLRQPGVSEGPPVA